MAQTRTFQRHALLPKPQDRTRFVPVIPQDAGLAFLLGDLAPEERRTLAEIVDRSDLLMVNERPWLLIQASPDLLDRLATFQAGVEDLEPDLHDEIEQDDDRDNDNPADRDGLLEDREDADEPEEDDPGEPEHADISSCLPAGFWGDGDPLPRRGRP